MSHVVSIQTEVRDPAAVAAACQRLHLPAPVQGAARLYGGQTAEGLLVQLPGWDYPLAIDTASGEVRYDNYRGAWGDDRELGRFLQAYLVEKAKREAQRLGYACTETPLADGWIDLQIQETYSCAPSVS